MTAMIASAPSAETLLTPEMLARFDERAPQYDRENRFFTEDFEELRGQRLPDGLAARGARRARARTSPRSIACSAASPTSRRPPPGRQHAPVLGRAVRRPHRAGDPSGDWILARGRRGQVFAAGHGEAGNDLPVLLSRPRPTGSTAAGSHRPQDLRQPLAGVELPRRARDGHSDPANPQIVHGFLHRDTPGYRIEETWDALGMRATGRNDTILDRTFVPDEARHSCARRVRRRRAVPRRPVRLGAARFRRASTRRSPAGRTTRPSPRCRAHVGGADPLDGLPPRGAAPRRRDAHPPRSDGRPPRPGVRRLVDGVDHGMEWPVKIVACKYDVVNRAWAVVDTALDLTGGVGHLQAQPVRAAVP